jgi:spore coat polysaccharide biosynthesis protein SpsF
MYKQRKEKIVATIEVRMTSSRLPGKVLMPIAGMPALELLITRLKRSKYLDAICVATTTNPQDDPVITLAKKLGVGYFRGSESDVLGRVLGAAQSMSADIIVEITGDCPFEDPALIDRGIEEFFTHDVDCATNLMKETFAIGFDVQVFPTKVLAEVDTLTQEPIDRTHVSYYIYQHPEKYRLHNWEADPDCYGPDHRMTLDEEADYQALCAVADALFPENSNFSARDITQYLRAHPEVVAINKHVRQKEHHEL